VLTPVEVSRMTDPEDSVSVSAEEFAEHEVDLVEGTEGAEVPLEAEPADAFDQQLELPDDGEDDYR
jgi:hypothetical protein